MSSAIWNAIPSASPNSPSSGRSGPAPSRHAASKSFAVFEGAALEVGLRRRVGVVRLPPLHRLAAREAEGGVREHVDRPRIAELRQLGEGTGEEVVPRGACRPVAVRAPGGRRAAPELRAVDQVVVHECRHVDELGGEPRLDRRRAVRRRQVAEQRTEPLAAGRERFASDLGDERPVVSTDSAQPHFDLVQEGGQPGCFTKCRELSRHVVVPYGERRYRRREAGTAPPRSPCARAARRARPGPEAPDAGGQVRVRRSAWA